MPIGLDPLESLRGRILEGKVENWNAPPLPASPAHGMNCALLIEDKAFDDGIQPEDSRPKRNA